VSLRLVSALVAGAVAAAGASALVVWLGGPSDADRAGRYAGSQPPAGIAMGEFELRNYDGRVVRSRDLRGRVVVLTFLDSQCTESCPVIAWTVARALDELAPAEREQVVAVAVTTDPAEDTRASVRRFLTRNRANGQLLYVGGGQPADVLRGVWKNFFVLSSLESGEDTLHSAPVRVYDRDGTWVSTLHAGADLTEAGLANDVRIALGG
jgi:protein SCO1/2